MPRGLIPKRMYLVPFPVASALKYSGTCDLNPVRPSWRRFLLQSASESYCISNVSYYTICDVGVVAIAEESGWYNVRLIRFVV